MDVSLSILIGLGLRFFLFSFAPNAGPADILTTALLGLWEGAVVHQLSGRSSSPNLDHLLAYGLRLSVDLLFSKNLQRTLMVVLWSALATIASEAIIPHATLRSTLKKERERERERRHRRSRSSPTAVPIIAPPLPPRVRAYKPPEPQISLTIHLPLQPPLTSTPIFPSAERPPTPPSFFLQENSALSPSPKPLYIQTLEPIESSPPDALPVRPRSGLATVFDRSPDSGSPLPVPMHLPTPPDSAQSANPSDGLIDVQSNEPYNDSHVPRYEREQLSTILELSPENNSDTPPAIVNDEVVQPNLIDGDDDATEIIQQETLPATMFGQSSANTNAPLPVPNAGMRLLPSGTVAKWLASQSTRPDADAIFTTPFSPSMSPRGPLPVLLRQKEPLWQIQTPIDNDNNLQIAAALVEDINAKVEVEDTGNLIADSDSDELRTPGQREDLHIETDNDDDPLLTPKRLRLDEPESQLSPLGLNLQSVLHSPGYRDSSSPITPTHQVPDHFQEPEIFNAGPDTEDFPMPGSISQNMLLQPPLPPSGPLFRTTLVEPPPESPPPPSPSTILSDPSDASVLSTRVPAKLFMRADQLRQKAREEEKIRAQLEEKRKLAESEGRTMDALELKIQVREMDAEAYKLHEKAARRYFVGKVLT